MKKYGILVYDYISIYQGVFDIISLPWDSVEVWPTQPPIKVTDNFEQVQYQWPKTVFFKIVESSTWGTNQNNAVDNSVSNWNADPSHADRQIPDTLQLVFTPVEAIGIAKIFEDERQRLINELNG